MGQVFIACIIREVSPDDLDGPFRQSWLGSPSSLPRGQRQLPAGEETNCESAAVCDSGWIYTSSPCPTETEVVTGSVLPAMDLPAFSRKLCLVILCS